MGVLLKLLSQPGASLSARASQGGTPLHWAANGRNLPAIQQLLELRADPLQRNTKGRRVLDLPVLARSEWRGPEGERARELLAASMNSPTVENPLDHPAT